MSILALLRVELDMIIIDTAKCPIKIEFVNHFDRDYLENNYLSLEYKNSFIYIQPYPETIRIGGDIPVIALGVALLVQGTLETLDGDNILDDAFSFNKEGMIEDYWNVKNKEQIKEFVDTYNRIYSTVMLLKE